MPIRFQFNLAKAIAVMARILSRLGPTDKVKLTKLVFLADRQNFLMLGYPITGDRQCAMKHGPVPSSCLDALNGSLGRSKVFEYIIVENNRVGLVKPAPDGLLSPEELDVIDLVIDEHGSKHPWQLVRATHGLPEYKEAYVQDTSTTIPYERILRHSGDEKHFRLGRPVISPTMAAHMVCPFDSDDSNL